MKEKKLNYTEVANISRETAKHGDTFVTKGQIAKIINSGLVNLSAKSVLALVRGLGVDSYNILRVIDGRSPHIEDNEFAAFFHNHSEGYNQLSDEAKAHLRSLLVAVNNEIERLRREKK